MSLPELPTWHDYNPVTGEGEPVTPLSAAQLNAFAEAIKARIAAAVAATSPDSGAVLYNATEANLARWRSAFAAASGGGAAARISVSGGSTPQGLGSGTDYLLSSWPKRMQAMMEARCGRGGTGMVIPWESFTTGRPENMPVWNFVGTIENRPRGVYSLGGKRIAADSGASYIEFGPVWCDTFRVMCIGSPGSVAAVRVDGVSAGTIRAETSTGSATATLPLKTGYATGVGVGQGQAVTDVPAGSLGWHTLRISSQANTVTVASVEGLVPGGVAVSNLGRGGTSSDDLVQDDAAVGMYGLSVAFDASRADLHIIQMVTNDFREHTPLATYKAAILTAVARQRATSPVANGGTPAAGDVLLIAGQPINLGLHPPDGIQVPSWEAYTDVLREVSDEQSVPLLVLDDLFVDFPTGDARGWYTDSLHPSALGAEVIASTVTQALTRAVVS